MPTADWWRAWETRHATTNSATTPTWTAPLPDTDAGGWVIANNSSVTWAVTTATTSAAIYAIPWLLPQPEWAEVSQLSRQRQRMLETVRDMEQVAAVARALDPEYNAAQELRRAEQNARIAAQAHEHARANSRAEILLREHLNPAQVDELAARGHFHLDAIAPNGERKRYRIRRGRHGNVDQVDAQGRVVKSLCVHPSVQCPDADTMLAQKLWLETNEPELLRVANVVPR